MIQLGIVLAVLGAGCFAVGVTMQHQGVALVRAGDTLRPSSLGALVRIPRWWLGVLSSSVGAVLHAIALGVAPLTVVQPVGVLALGLTAIINARVTGQHLTRSAVLAISASTGGVVAFLLLASGNVNSSAVPPSAEIQAAVPVALAIAVLALLGSRSHGRARALALSTAAGISYGFTSLLMRAVAQDFGAGGLGGVAIGSVVAMALTMAFGGWFMQQSYAAGPPQQAVASVTVVDPIVAVLIGVVLLGEAAGVSLWVGAGELVAGAIAIGGVIALAATQVRPYGSENVADVLADDGRSNPDLDLATGERLAAMSGGLVTVGRQNYAPGGWHRPFGVWRTERHRPMSTDLLQPECAPLLGGWHPAERGVSSQGAAYRNPVWVGPPGFRGADWHRSTRRG